MCNDPKGQAFRNRKNWFRQGNFDPLCFKVFIAGFLCFENIEIEAGGWEQCELGRLRKIITVYLKWNVSRSNRKSMSLSVCSVFDLCMQL